MTCDHLRAFGGIVASSDGTERMTCRRWESGETPISGPAAVAIDLMLKHGTNGQRENLGKQGPKNG